MAEQAVELAPGESEVVTFEATPHEARTYQVSVDGLSGSFMASLAPVNLSGVVSNAITGSPIAGVKIIFDGRQTSTNAAGEYVITELGVGKLGVAFSHIDFEAYQVAIILNLGDNRLDVALTRATTGRISLHEGYNMVTYTGRSQTVGEAFRSIEQYVANVMHFVDSAYYEPVSQKPKGVTRMMIPGDNYWVYVNQACVWTF